LQTGVETQIQMTLITML